MRERNVPEKYVKLIQDMYRGCQTKVRGAAVTASTWMWGYTKDLT